MFDYLRQGHYAPARPDRADAGADASRRSTTWCAASSSRSRRRSTGWTRTARPPLLELSRLKLLQQAGAEHYLQGQEADRRGAAGRIRHPGRALPQDASTTSRTSWSQRRMRPRRSSTQLKKGAKFDDLAKKDSMRPARRNKAAISAGSRRPTWSSRFADAVVALKKGEYTHTPVQTQYGWHVIQLDGHAHRWHRRRRSGQGPASHRSCESKKFRAYQDDLLKSAKVEKTRHRPSGISGDGGPAAVLPTRATACSAQQSRNPLIEHLDAELLGFARASSRLGAARPGSGPLRYGAATLAPERAQLLGGLLAGHAPRASRSAPQVWPASGLRCAPRRGAIGGQCTPSLRRRSSAAR